MSSSDEPTTKPPPSKRGKFERTQHENDGLSRYPAVTTTTTESNGQQQQRDVVGYADRPPKASWPNGAKVALNFVINYEEGGENCVLHGDAESEKLLSEIVGAEAYGTCLQGRVSSVLCTRL